MVMGRVPAGQRYATKSAVCLSTTNASAHTLIMKRRIGFESRVSRES